MRRFVVAGGETSGTVVARLGIDRLEIGAYQAPGVARATAGMRGAIVALSLKSGKLGPVDMFRERLEVRCWSGDLRWRQRTTFDPGRRS